MRLLLIFLFCALLSGCVTNEPSRDPNAMGKNQSPASTSRSKRQSLLQPSQKMDASKVIVASQEQSAIRNQTVAVYLTGQKTKFIQKPSRTYKVKNIKDSKELNALTQYVNAHRIQLGVAVNAKIKLGVKSVSSRKDRVFVKYEQYVERAVNKQKYKIPIVGSGVTIVLINDQVISLSSTIKSPPSLSLALQNPGFDLSKVTLVELEFLRKTMIDYGKTKVVNQYISNVSSHTGQKFDMDSWLKDTAANQLERVKAFFGGIKKTSTAKMIIDMARKNRISFVRRGTEWYMQATNLFDMPIEFDLKIPTTADSQLLVKNIRDTKRDVTISVYNSSNYPTTGPLVSRDNEVKSGAKIDRVTGVFQDIIGHYRDNFGWLGPGGTDPDFELIVNKNITLPDVAENAFWNPAGQHFGIGVGGPRLANLDTSISVLGHEYMHVIVEKTTGLVYAGESGALNEHAADVQGATLDAVIGGHPYSYIIGQDILTPAAVAQEQGSIDNLLQKSNVSNADIAKYNLDVVSLRHLLYPVLSFQPQPATVSEGIAQGYGPTCQPSQANDNCGVHMLSGVPNRAASLIINALGFENTMQLFFYTATSRLESGSNFSEYLRQLHEECMSTMNANDCEKVIKAFNEVGVQYPDGNWSPAPSPVPSDDDYDDYIPTPTPSSSPELKLCGWFVISKNGNVRIVDNQYDAVFIDSANANMFGGSFTEIESNDLNALFTPINSPMDCGCATGQIAETQNQFGEWLNYFTKITPNTLKFHKSTAGCSNIVLY